MESTNYKVTFEHRPVSAIQTVAELLCHAREEQVLSIEELAENLQISNLYLEALEQGDYGRLPSLIYTRNFVKKYGLRLNVNMSDLLELFEQEWQLFEKMQLSFLNVGQSEGDREEEKRRSEAVGGHHEEPGHADRLVQQIDRAASRDRHIVVA